MNSVIWIRPRHLPARLRRVHARLSFRQHRRSCARTGYLCLAIGLLLGLLFLGVAEGQTVTTFSETTVGVAASQTVIVTAQSAGTVSAVSVLTLGQPNLDFTAPALNTCTGASLMVGSTCQVAVTFTPRYPGTRNGAIVLVDSSNNVLATQYLSGLGRGALGVMVPGTMETAVGSGEWTAVNDGGPAAAADLYLPSGVTVDGAGNIYIADSYHNRIREVYASGPNQGLIETICNSNGVPGYTGDGQSALNATLNNPRSIALDGAGNLYIADSGNNVIREINASTGNISTIAGSGMPGFNGDGPALAADLNGPYGVTVDASGNVYIADTNNQRIREYTPATGSIATVAGNGYINANAGGGFSGDGGSPLQAELNLPYAVAFDAAGNMYIPDSANNRIRIVYASGANAGTINTFAGTGNPVYGGDGQDAASASFYAPSGVAVDVAGNLYIADTQNNRIRKVSEATGLVSTVAGNGIGLYGGDGANAAQAGLFGPYGLFLDSVGNLYIADYFDHRIRSILSNAAVLTFTPAIREDQVTAPQSQTIENDGNAAMTFTTILPDANAKVDAATTTCSVSVTVSVDGTCKVGAEFAPTEVGNPVIGNVNLTGSPANGPLDIQVVDQALALTSTTTTLIATPSPALYRAQVALTASVTTGTGTLSGSVTFKDGATVLGTVALSVGGSGLTGSATFTTSSFTVGPHALTATYTENGGVHSSSTSSTFTENVEETTSTALVSSENPSVSGDSVTFTATVTAAANGGTAPTGTIVFYDGSAILGSAALTGNTAALTTSALTVGTHTIKAIYSGDSENATSTSANVSQLVKAITTVAVVGVANPANFESSVTFTATVHGNGGTPTGSVAFTADGNSIGSASLNLSGSASVSLSTLAVGTHSIVATYAGDSKDAGSTSTAYTETVSKAATTTSLAATPNPSAFGQSVTFTVTLHSGTVAATGSISLLDNSNTIATTPVGAGGAASFSISTLAVGSHSITAVYSGDSNYTTSTSTVVTQKVLPTTQAVVTSSANPSIAGSSVALTVTVTGSAGAPSGSVTLRDGTATLAGLVLNSSGTATYTTTSLAVGSHSITAVYGGDANNAGVTSPAFTQTVSLAPTTTTVSASSNPATAGKSITLTANVSGATPTGVVKFFSQSALLGSSNLNGSGVATFATSTLAVGSDAITATYVGDARNSTSTSTAYPLSVVQATTTASLVSNQNPEIALRTVSFTATVTGTGATPSGVVIFSDGATPLATVPLAASGVAVYATAGLSVGQHIITAAYQGDADNAAASAGLTETIQQAAPTIAVVSNNNPAIAGAGVTFTATSTGATGTPTGIVTFQDGSTLIGTVNLTNGSAALTTSVLGVGQHAITATYSGDANNAPASSAPITQIEQETTTTALASSNNPSTGGTSVTFTATVSGSAHGNVTGTVTFKNGAAILGTGTITAGVATFSTAALPVGADTITAVYSGDTLNAASTSASLPQAVMSANTGTALASTGNPAFFQTAITFTATVTGNGATPTGTVSFQDGATTLAVENLNAAGVATYATSSLAVGVHAITAVYSGDTEDQPSASATVNQVIQAHTAVALTSRLNPALAVAPVTFNITVTDGTGTPPAGTVTLMDGATALAPLTLASGAATYSTSSLVVGQHSITAVYAGNTIDVSSTSPALAQAIQAIPTKTTLGASSTSVTTAQPLTLVASVFSAGTVPITGTVTFQNGSTVVGSTALTAAGTATITPTLTAGTYSIVAVYSGDANNATSLSMPASVTVTQATGFHMALNPSTVSIPTTQHSVVTLTLQSVDGFTDQLGLGCASLPADVTCNFSQPMVSLASDGTETVQLTIDTASPLASGATARNEMPGAPRPAIVAAWIFPAGAIFGLFWWRARKKLNGLLCALLVVVLSGTVLTLSGCAGLSDSSAAPGTYTIQVTADGAKTGMTNAVNIVVTVSQ